MLGGGVRCDVGGAVEARAGGDRDDPSSAAATHRGQHAAQHAKHRVDVHVEDELDVGVRRLLREANRTGNSRGQNTGVDGAHAGQHGRQEALHGGRIAQVDGLRPNLYRLQGEFCVEIGEAGSVCVGERQRKAARAQCMADRTSDRSCGAGHKRDGSARHR